MTQALADLDKAIRLLRQLRMEISPGPHAPWLILSHASEYLDRQYSELLRAPIE